ncbi:unnamed protein product, partial [Choristocarpus tenellus]
FQTGGGRQVHVSAEAMVMAQKAFDGVFSGEEKGYRGESLSVEADIECSNSNTLIASNHPDAESMSVVDDIAVLCINSQGKPKVGVDSGAGVGVEAGVAVRAGDMMGVDRPPSAMKGGGTPGTMASAGSSWSVGFSTAKGRRLNVTAEALARAEQLLGSGGQVEMVGVSRSHGRGRTAISSTDSFNRKANSNDGEDRPTGASRTPTGIETKGVVVGNEGGAVGPRLEFCPPQTWTGHGSNAEKCGTELCGEGSLSDGSSTNTPSVAASFPTSAATSADTVFTTGKGRRLQVSEVALAKVHHLFFEDRGTETLG